MMFVNSAVSQYPSLAFQFAFDKAGENFHTAALMLRWTRILVRLRESVRALQAKSESEQLVNLGGTRKPWARHLY